MSNPEESNYLVELPGIPEELQSLAEADIRQLSNAVAAAADEMGIQFLLKRIRLTSCFEHDVNELLQERSGLTGYLATRRDVQAIGKTIWTRSHQGTVGFTVMVDANQIGPWGLDNPRCLTTVLHELIHVVYEGNHLIRLGEEEYTAVGDTRERRLERWARLLLDEFAVDRFVDVLVSKLMSKSDGQPCSLRDLEEAQGLDWVQWLLDGLYTMPQIVDEKVWQFRTRQISIGDLDSAVCPHVLDILTLLFHTASIYVGSERWPEIAERVSKTEASQRFLREHLETMLAQLGNPQLRIEDSLQLVEHSIEGIFYNCGLSFKTTPEGVYISVSAPSQ